LVRVDREKHIDFATTSPFGGARAGRVKRRNAKREKVINEQKDFYANILNRVVMMNKSIYKDHDPTL